MSEHTGMDAVALAALLRNGYDCNHQGYRDGGYRNEWRNPPEQSQANMDLMHAIGQVDKAVAVGTAEMEASQAAQSASIVSQLNNVAGSLAARTDGLKDVVNNLGMHLAEKMCAVDKTVMENRYELSKDITTDGEKTRALVTAQYEATLNRLLAEARNEIIELRHDNRSTRHAHDNAVSVTQTVNQAQQQAQQQGQFDRLYHMLSDAVQNIRATNQAINIGSGMLRADPTNNNTNTSVR